jgi:hypothetical protein
MAADAAALLRRHERLKSRRSVVEDKWRECYQFTYPLRGSAFETMGAPAPEGSNASNAASRQAELLDSTGTDSTRILASGMQSGLTPSNSRWPGLELGDESDEERRWLEQCAQILWENIHASNYDSVAFDCMLDMAIAGMFPMFVNEAPDGGYLFDEWPLATSYFASSVPAGPIDTVFNEFPLSAEQAVADYGENMVSEKVRKLIDDDKPDEQVTFVRCVYPRPGTRGLFPRNMPIASVHIDKDSKQVVRESGYHEQPIGVPRWQQVPGSVYAFGSAFDALPDMKTLNEVVRFDLANMDLALAGMWGAVDDGVLNPRSITIGPRKVIVMADKDNFFSLTPGGDFKAAVLEIDRLQRAIRKVFMADQLEPQAKPGTPPTATEIVVRVELLRQLLGPVYGRMQSEYLKWLVVRCFGLAYRAGVFTPPPRSIVQRSQTIGVTYNSPIARAQKAVDVSAMDRYELALTNEAAINGPGVLDNYHWDKAARRRAELLGVPGDLIPDEDEIAAMREQRSNEQQAANLKQIAAQSMAAAAGAA